MSVTDTWYPVVATYLQCPVSRCFRGQGYHSSVTFCFNFVCPYSAVSLVWTQKCQQTLCIWWSTVMKAENSCCPPRQDLTAACVAQCTWLNHGAAQWSSRPLQWWLWWWWWWIVKRLACVRWTFVVWCYVGLRPSAVLWRCWRCALSFPKHNCSCVSRFDNQTLIQSQLSGSVHSTF